jgi:hypothetical protein
MEINVKKNKTKPKEEGDNNVWIYWKIKKHYSN